MILAFFYGHKYYFTVSDRLILVWASQIVKTICLEHLDSAPVLDLLISKDTELDTNTTSWFTKIPLGSNILSTEPIK
jgi:hypothetical protein